MAHYQLGVALLQTGDPQQAESEWTEAVRRRPNFPEAWRDLGASATHRGDWKSLENIGDKLKTIAPRSAEGYLYHATAKFNQGDAAAAEVDLNHLIALAPQNPMGYVKLAQLRMAQKRPSDAETLYRQALTHDANSLEALQGLVAIDFDRKKDAEGLKLIQAQLARTPDSSAVYLMMAQAQLHMHRPEDAEVSLTRAVELDGQNLAALMLLGQLQAKRQEYDQAAATYQRAIKIAPNEFRVYLSLGELNEAQKNWQQAEDYYQKALTMQPEDPLSSNNLAYLMLEHGGSVNVALNLAQTARKGLPNQPSSADTLGWAYYHNGAYSVAQPLLETAVKQVPTNQTYLYHLGLTYQKLNDAARARAELEKAIHQDPASPTAEQARQALNQVGGTN